MTRVLCVGECMLELRHLDDVTLRLGCAGDTYNTAVYLRRVATELGLQVGVGYLTGVGDDSYSTAIRLAWAAGGVEDRAVVIAGRRPGIYAIRPDECGERHFHYWRGESAARHLFSGTDWVDQLDADVVYLSGITLQLTTSPGRAALAARPDRLRQQGSRIVLDTNYRADCWPSAAEAAESIDGVAAHADLVLATLTDETALRGPASAPQAAHHIAALGPAEVVIKAGADGAWVWSEGELTHVPARTQAQLVDTTAAGDSFAGAYLAARLAGQRPLQAAALAARVAAIVIGYPGAITPRDIPLTVSPSPMLDGPGSEQPKGSNNHGNRRL